MSDDTHAKTIGNRFQYADLSPETIDGTGYAEALKITFCDDIEVVAKTLLGGREDCLDVVRTGTLTVRDCQMTAGERTRTFITAKAGGSHTYRNITVEGGTRWPWQISLGDWTIYNQRPEYPPMRQVTLDNVRREDGKRLVVLQLYCDRVDVKDSETIVLNLRRLAPAYFWILRKFRTSDPRGFEPVPDFID